MGGPVHLCLETSLEHDWDLGVYCLDMGNDFFDVFQQPLGTMFCEGGGGSEVREVVVIRWFVDRLDGVGIRVSGCLYEVDKRVDGTHRPVQVCLVPPPAPVSNCLADVQSISATRQGVDIDNNVHVVFLNGVICDLAQVVLLVAMVHLGSRELDPSSIGCWDTENRDSSRGQLINIGSCNVGCVSVLEDGCAFVAEVLA